MAKEKPIGAGHSSFELIQAEVLFAALELGPETVLVDAACGPGHYALAAADRLGAGGAVYAVDLWPEGIDQLQKAAAARGQTRLFAIEADVSKRLPLADRQADICLMATALHDLLHDHVHEGALREVARVLKPGGQFAVVEFKKIEPPPGPPRHIRLTPEETEKLVRPHGFRVERQLDLGPYNYLLLFRRTP